MVPALDGGFSPIGEVQDGLLVSLPEVIEGFYPLAADTTTTTCLGIPQTHTFDPKHAICERPPQGCPRVQQVGATALGPVFSMAWVCRSCPCNALNALLLRHGVRQPDFTASFSDYGYLHPEFAAAYAAADALYYDGWLSKWSESKRVAIEYSVLHDPVRPNRVKAFVKREVYHKPARKARLIQGYSTLATQERCAREFTCFQKALSMVFGVQGGGREVFSGIYLSFASGANGVDLSVWMSLALDRCQGRPMFYERDGKNWDATMQRPHHELKLAFMRVVSPRLAAFVDASYSVKGVVRAQVGRIVYRLEGTVKSGHNDTTSGNSLVNGLIAAESMRSCGLRGSIIVAGDDLLTVVDGDFDCERLIAAESGYGIIPEARKFSDVSDVHFISGCWLAVARNPTRYIFAPLLGRLLCRLWWTTNPPGRKRLADYLYSVSSGLLATCRDLPMYREFVTMHGVLRGSLITTDRLRYSPYVCVQAQTQPDVVLETLCAKYRLSLLEITSFVGFLNSHSGVGFCRHPVADAIIFRDTCDIGVRPTHDGPLTVLA
jgi:hypothetical protein